MKKLLLFFICLYTICSCNYEQKKKYYQHMIDSVARIDSLKGDSTFKSTIINGVSIFQFGKFKITDLKDIKNVKEIKIPNEWMHNGYNFIFIQSDYVLVEVHRYMDIKERKYNKLSDDDQYMIRNLRFFDIKKYNINQLVVNVRLAFFKENLLMIEINPETENDYKTHLFQDMFEMKYGSNNTGTYYFGSRIVKIHHEYGFFGNYEYRDNIINNFHIKRDSMIAKHKKELFEKHNNMKSL